MVNVGGGSQRQKKKTARRKISRDSKLDSKKTLHGPRRAKWNGGGNRETKEGSPRRGALALARNAFQYLKRKGPTALEGGKGEKKSGRWKKLEKNLKESPQERRPGEKKRGKKTASKTNGKRYD